MGRFTPPAPSARLDALDDVDVTAGDGLVAGATLTYPGSGKWRPELASALSGQRQSGPARDVLTNVSAGVATKGEGAHVTYDGAVWGVGSASAVVRHDPTPSGVASTTGSGTLPSGAAMSTGRWSFAATGTTLYCVARPGGGSPINFYRVVDENNVVTLGNGPVSNGDYAIAPVGEGLLAVDRFGGVPGAQLYDPFTDTWSAVAAPPYETRSPKLVSIGGYVYAFGATSGAGMQAVARYDPLADTWERLNDAPATITPVYASYCPFGSLIYAFGGGAALHLYSPDLDVWEQQSPTGPTPDNEAAGQAHAAAVIGSRIYLANDAGAGGTTVHIYG